MKKRLVFILVGVLLLSSAIFAASFRKNITVDYMGIKLVVDGREVVMGNDMAGNKIEPFAYEGTTYLPVRALAEALGKTVQWDEATKTIFIGDGAAAPAAPVADNQNNTPAPSTGQYLTDVMEPFSKDRADIYKTSDRKTLSLAGKEYTNGIIYDSHYNRFGHTNFNLDGKYTNLTGKLGADQEGSTIRFDFIADGTIIQSYDIISGQLPVDVNLNVSGVKLLEIKFEVITDYRISKSAFTDIMVR